jgi:hypothetical protein
MIALSMTVQLEVAGVLPRLLTGAAATAMVACVSLWLFVPTLRRHVGVAVRRRS